jgi:hypothetical protein
MPQLTTAQTYNAAIRPASNSRDVDFWSDLSSHHSSHFRPHRFGSRKLFSRRHMRTYRAWLWGLAAGLKTLGILGAFLLAIRAGWLGTTAVAATVAGLLLRYVLEATSQGD